MLSSVPWIITTLPRNDIARKLLTFEIKRLLRKYGSKMPRDFIIGMESTIIGDRTGNWTHEGKCVFRVSTTSVWFAQRLTDISIAIDGKSYAKKDFYLLDGDEKIPSEKIDRIPFIPGRTYSVIIPGLTLPDGIHFVDIRLKSDLQNLDYAGLPILLENGSGGVPSAIGAVPPLDESRKITVHYMPHIHYDVEWIFDRERFLQTGARNLLEAAAILDDDPDHTFILDQGPQVEPFFERFPVDAKKFSDWAREGRVEAVNGLWAEPDVNMAGGESLVRGAIYWQRYVTEKFGAPSKVGWFIDCFGQSAQIPQILKKSGTPYFVFNRVIHDNDHPTEFWWEGPDGSRVLTHWMKGMYNVGYPIMEEPDLAASRFKRTISFIAPNRTSDHLMYGAGVDHGRPLGFAKDRIADWNAAHPNTPIKKSTPVKFFESLDQSKLTTVKGDFQRDLWGVYSTRIKGKIQNRRCEVKVQAAETWAAAASLHGLDFPTDELDRAWKEILSDQFHDCICGCSSDDVAEGIERRLYAVEAVLDGIKDKAQKHIAARIVNKADGAPLVVFNPLSWKRNEWIEATAYFQKGISDPALYDEAGNAVPFQTLDRHYYYGGDTLELRFGFVAELPPLGWRTFYVRQGASGQAAASSQCSASTGALSSDMVRVELDPRNGLVKNIRDLAGGNDFAFGKGNTLHLQRDIGTLYNTLPLPGGWKSCCSDVRVVESGPLRSVVESRGAISKNEYTTRVKVRAGSPRVDFEMDADFVTPYRRLRAEFPVNFKGTWRHGIPYGIIERPRHELPARDFADLSDDRKGFTLIQFGIPGTSLEHGRATLTLWRSTDLIHFIPAGPGSLSLGKHSFRYAVYPHGPYESHNPRRRAKEHNILPNAIQVMDPTGKASIASRHSLVETNSEDVNVEALYREGDEILMRLLECRGRSGKVKAAFGFKAKSADSTDFIGNVEEKLEIRDGAVELNYSPWKIMTIRARLG